ncbi:hypothetical protein JNUCC32_20030 [Paenibacillus sp. JNUCC32]|uniref:hypothetical protein n=1 Tax=Paenibacillus sp. JNUCC32 TaxID=2777984 RepID=UPI0017878727|nr:hypothetical protein [Paenibacillus sp. JNUCC-32]QOT08443.1 hypothetical protein JNUCC32_20030 [Paenibacillus sp. JNUCC-32]
MKKKILSSLLLLSLVGSSLSGAVFADESKYSQNVVDLVSDPSVNPIGKVVRYENEVNVKPLIANAAENNVSSFKTSASQMSPEELDMYLAKVAVGQEEKFTDEFFEVLESNGLVYYELGQDNSVVTPHAQNGDIQVNTPFGLYNSTTKYWEIWGGFKWTNANAWWEEARKYLGFANPTGPLGGADTAGINLIGGTNGAALKEFHLQPIWQDAPSPYNNGKTGSYSAPQQTNRVGTFDSKHGAMFKFQDSVSGFGLGSDGYAKYAMNFGSGAVKLAYDSKFSGASGNAVAYMRHTWDKTYVDNVTLNSNGSFSVTIKGGTAATDTLIGPDYAY